MWGNCTKDKNLCKSHTCDIAVFLGSFKSANIPMRNGKSAVNNAGMFRFSYVKACSNVIIQHLKPNLNHG